MISSIAASTAARPFDPLPPTEAPPMPLLMQNLRSRSARFTPIAVFLFAVSLFAVGLNLDATADSPGKRSAGEKLFSEDFENGLDRWEIIDPESWALQEHGLGESLSITRRESEYRPPVRSPHHIALIRDLEVASFVLTFKVKSTKDTGNHRDCCVFFNYQGPSQYYYVHLGAKPDPHSGQIFIVNDAPRTALTQSDKRTPWSEAWHDVKVVRDTEKGTIEVYFDDMTTPQLQTTDKTFGTGRIGIGSFDDMDAFDQIVLKSL